VEGWIGVLKVLIFYSCEGERQCGLQGNHPLRIMKVPI